MAGGRRNVTPHQETRETDRLRQGSDAIQRQLKAEPLMGGRVIYDVVLTGNAATRVSHGLGHAPRNSMLMHVRCGQQVTRVLRIIASTAEYVEYQNNDGDDITVNVWVT